MYQIWQKVVVFGVVFGVAGASAQGPQVGRLMREKLDRSQKILGAVVTSDWGSLQSNSAALEQLTRDPRWTVLKYPEYSKYSMAFVRSLETLRQAAADRDAEKTPEAYTDVILKCVECHRYLARSRLAR